MSDLKIWPLRKFPIAQKNHLNSELDDAVGACLDDYLTLKLLRGLIYRVLNKPKQACDAFKDVIERKQRLSAKSPLAAMATIELGTTLIAAGNFTEGRFWLKNARIEYSDILNDMRTVYRVDRGIERTDLKSDIESDGVVIPGNMSKRRSSTSEALKSIAAKVKSQMKRSNSIGFNHADLP